MHSMNKMLTAAVRKVLRWDLCCLFYILTIYHQLHFFNQTLFTDDTFLSMADKNLDTLKKKELTLN